MTSLTPKATTLLGEILRASGCEADAAEVGAQARACFRIASLSPSEPGPVGASRIGGTPDLPGELVWPVVDRCHLTFLAQVDLSELDPGYLPELPARGWLYFFLGLDEPAADVEHRVLFYDGSIESLARRSPPEGTTSILEDERRFTPCRVRFGAGISLALDDMDEELATALSEAFDDVRTRIGGHPVAFSGDPRMDAHLCKSGLKRILYDRHMEGEDLDAEVERARRTGRDAWAEELYTELRPMLDDFHRRRADHERAAADWMPLFVLGSEDEAGMCWWDAGLIQFMVRRQDLARRSFGLTYCHVATS